VTPEGTLRFWEKLNDKPQSIVAGRRNLRPFYKTWVSANLIIFALVVRARSKLKNANNITNII
jgi:hypothetical protein